MSVSQRKSITIDAPIDHVMDVQHDFERQTQWWPGMHEAETLESDDQGRTTRGRLVNEVAKVGRDEFTLSFQHRDDGVSWQLDKPSLIQKKQTGDWSFVDQGDRTEATLSLEIDTTLPLPGFVQKKILDGIVKGALAGLKQASEA